MNMAAVQASLQEQLQELVNKQQVTENEVAALNKGAQKQNLEVQQLILSDVKQTDKEVYLPAFYTHLHGYRMCICVYPNPMQYMYM